MKSWNPLDCEWCDLESFQSFILGQRWFKGKRGKLRNIVDLSNFQMRKFVFVFQYKPGNREIENFFHWIFFFFFYAIRIWEKRVTSFWILTLLLCCLVGRKKRFVLWGRGKSIGKESLKKTIEKKKRFKRIKNLRNNKRSINLRHRFVTTILFLIIFLQNGGNQGNGFAVFNTASLLPRIFFLKLFFN